jgi:hypothetical protein
LSSRRKWFGIARIIAAITAIVALIGDVNFTIGTSPFAISNFFSYFTVQSMMLNVVVLGMGALSALRNTRDPIWLDQARALATTYVTVSGIVFAVILIEGTSRGVPVWAPWSSQLLHFVLPAYSLLDWWLAPGREVPWKTLALVMLFPGVWVVYTLVRGAQVYWYPYFFLDPALVEIPWELCLYLLAIVAVFSLIVALLISVSRRHHSRVEARRGSDRGRARGSQALPPGTLGRRTPSTSRLPHPR